MKDETLMIHTARQSEKHQGIVNMPVYRASTVLYPTLAEFKNRHTLEYDGMNYGASGTPTTFALADAVAALEGGMDNGARGVATSSGLAAVSMALCAFLKAGDHLLMVDSVYKPTRNFCDDVLKGFGVRTTYYDPLIGEGIAELIEENTRVVFLESPGSMTFEMQDIPAIANIARKKDITVMLDNTWATPMYFKPFTHGVDVSIQAGTKYIAGHSDLVIGLITARNEELYRRIKGTVLAFGDVPGPDDSYLALRGLRSMAARLERHQASGLKVASWLQTRPEVKRVLYPALPDDPGHALWLRDFTGATSLFGLVLHTSDEAEVGKMLDSMKLFKMGASWGGYESLVRPAFTSEERVAVPWKEPGYLMRLHVGLEHPDDLIDDLASGLDRLTTRKP